jgi:predicted HicB family RNase H-like nuclease
MHLRLLKLINKPHEGEEHMNKSKKDKSVTGSKTKKSPSSISQSSTNKSQSLPPGKEPLKTLYLRIPKSFWEEIQTIANLTGLSMNAVCLDLLRPSIKTKLKQLQED